MVDYRQMARDAAERHGFNPDVFEKQIETESDFDPNAYNPSGASGIAQIVPSAHPGVDVWNPEESLDYAAKWMSELVRQYGSVRNALIAYNWGPGNLQRWNGDDNALPNETRRYLTSILGPEWNEPGETNVGDNTEMVSGYVFPVRGYVGKINNHWATDERGATDIFAARGTDVVAMRDGKVRYVGNDQFGGNNVLIEGSDGLMYYYAHLDEWPSVRYGENVALGQYLGPLGDTGNAKAAGPHLHLGAGHGIIDGTGPQGGAGRNFDLVGLLEQIQAGTIEPELSEEEMQRIAELEAEVARLNEELAAEKSWAGATIEDILKPTAHELHQALQGTFTKDKRAKVERARDRLSKWANGEDPNAE